MTSSGSSKKFPTSQAAIDAAIARAPGKDRPLTAREEAEWRMGVKVDGGGYEAVRKALADRHELDQPGPQVAPTK
jgi:hypothetical protein